jgi:hypothetical protein
MVGSKFYKNYMEFFFLVLMVLGIVISLLAQNPFIRLTIIFMAGFFAGKVMYERKTNIRFPYVVIFIGFLIGFLLGAYYSSKILIGFFFILGAVVGYKLYEKGLIRDLKFGGGGH